MVTTEATAQLKPAASRTESQSSSKSIFRFSSHLEPASNTADHNPKCHCLEETSHFPLQKLQRSLGQFGQQILQKMLISWSDGENNQQWVFPVVKLCSSTKDTEDMEMADNIL